MKYQVQRSLDALAHWVESRGYQAYDPGDGQLSFLRFFTFGQHSLRRLLTAAVLRAPFNVRPWLGIPPHTSTKGMGYMAWGYLRRYTHTGDTQHLDRARYCLQWLIEHRSPGFDDYCWGNHFAFSTRSGTIPAFTPTIVWTGLIGQAFLQAYHVSKDEQYLSVARSIARWILSLPREQTDSGICLSYVPHMQSSIHNSNMLGAAFLGQVGALTGDRTALQVAAEAMRYSCSRINPDGSWYYGEDPKYHWIDNFHTGYNLDSLKRYIESTGDRTCESTLTRGFAYFKKTFFEPDGRPRYYHDRTYPTDIQCAAQAIDTLTYFSDQDSDSLALAQKVARWTIDHMQGKDGHFYYRDLGWIVNKTPMFHWGQATMFKALAHLLSRLEPSGERIAARDVEPYARQQS